MASKGYVSDRLLTRQAKKKLFHQIDIFFSFQSTLVCAFEVDALPCEAASSFYNGPDSINDSFGKVIES